MAILGEIRKRIWILFGLVGLAMFAFLFNPDQWSQYFKSDPNLYGKVNGENISRAEFTMFNNYLQGQSQGQQISEDQTWKMIVQSKLIADKFDKSGMKLTENNFWNYAQYSSIFANDRSLYDAKGNFDSKPLRKIIDDLKQKSGEDQALEAQYLNWLSQRKIAEYEIKAKLYFSAINKGLFTNDKELKLVQKQSTENAEIDYIHINYDSYNQKNKISVSEDEINEYIKKHPKKFKTDPSVSLKYVVFENKNTALDDSIIFKEIKLFAKGGILKDEKGAILDSIKPFNNISLEETPSFIDEYSDLKFNKNFTSNAQQPEPIKDWIKSNPVGATFGPYTFANYYILSKIMAKKTSDSTLTKHILISYKGVGDPSVTRTKDQAKKMADSIFTNINTNPTKFVDYLKFSDDKGSAAQGGIVGWSTPDKPQFVPQFQQFVDESPKGKIGLVETQYGFHIMEISDKKTGEEIYQIANLVKERKALDKTTENTYNKATAFAQSVQNKSEKEFDAIGKKKNYQVLEQNGISRFVGNINGINPQSQKVDEILSWAFDKKNAQGTTNIFTTPTNDHYVVLLTAKNPKGLATAQMVKPEVEPIVRNQKIAKILSDKINASKKSLDQIAKEFGQVKKSASVNFQRPMIPEIGSEPKVVGAAFGITKNTVSQAIEGKSGVFVITTKNIVKDGANIDVNQIKQMLRQQTQQMASYSIVHGLESSAKIEDYRIEANQR